MHLYNCICVQIKKYKIWIKHLGQTGVRSTSNLQLPVRVKIHTYEAWSKACGRKSLSLRGTTPTMQSTNTFSFKYFHWLARLINQEHQPKRKLSRIYSIHDSSCTYNGKAYLVKWGSFQYGLAQQNQMWLQEWHLYLNWSHLFFASFIFNCPSVLWPKMLNKNRNEIST